MSPALSSPLCLLLYSVPPPLLCLPLFCASQFHFVFDDCINIVNLRAHISESFWSPSSSNKHLTRCSRSLFSSASRRSSSLKQSQQQGRHPEN